MDTTKQQLKAQAQESGSENEEQIILNRTFNVSSKVTSNLKQIEKKYHLYRHLE